MNSIIVDIAPDSTVECELKLKDTAPRLQDQVAIDCGATAMNM